MTAAVLGIYAGLPGIQHGAFEILQGSDAPAGLMAQTISLTCQPESVWHVCLPALTFVPNFLVTGLLAVVTGGILHLGDKHAQATWRSSFFLRSRKNMKRNPYLAGVLSLLVPGLGQIYTGSGAKGAAVIAVAIVIGNLNILILPLIAMANPSGPQAASNGTALWAYWIPRVVHDILSFWSIAFWLWAVGDAVSLARKAPAETT